ncbi:hypothetical protein F7725_020182 [Dissostichus mawsoni]|uniref:Uncharacterized protein n=1 Tax=Dissostichus mawsoni TaxID=36200 RepID=A0A7J5YCH4_DISMA|nr:hypothetical protein F7725_020182 [Dissostichus mawsoni]
MPNHKEHASVSDLPQPPVDFNGEVDMECFGTHFHWKESQKNPFAVPPTFHFWAPWIGKNTRRSNHVLNTEFAKVRPQKPAEVQEITVTEDRLREELYKQKVSGEDIMQGVWIGFLWIAH